MKPKPHPNSLLLRCSDLFILKSDIVESNAKMLFPVFVFGGFVFAADSIVRGTQLPSPLNSFYFVVAGLALLNLLLFKVLKSYFYYITAIIVTVYQQIRVGSLFWNDEALTKGDMFAQGI